MLKLCITAVAAISLFAACSPMPVQQPSVAAAATPAARIELKPGTHTLQLLLADHNHIPHHPLVISERITVTVK